MTNYQHIAEQMYAAYCQQTGGLTFDGKPLPSFQELGLERQTCWNAAAEAGLLEFAKEWLSRQGGDDNYMTAKARAAIAKATGRADSVDGSQKVTP